MIDRFRDAGSDGDPIFIACDLVVSGFGAGLQLRSALALDRSPQHVVPLGALAMLALRGAMGSTTGHLILVDGVARIRDGLAAVEASLYLFLRRHVNLHVPAYHLRIDVTAGVRLAQVRSSDLPTMNEYLGFQRLI